MPITHNVTLTLTKDEADWICEALEAAREAAASNEEHAEAECYADAYRQISDGFLAAATRAAR